jgi:hypothetical protein
MRGENNIISQVKGVKKAILLRIRQYHQIFMRRILAIKSLALFLKPSIDRLLTYFGWRGNI